MTKAQIQVTSNKAIASAGKQLCTHDENCTCASKPATMSDRDANDLQLFKASF